MRSLASLVLSTSTSALLSEGGIAPAMPAADAAAPSSGSSSSGVSQRYEKPSKKWNEIYKSQQILQRGPTEFTKFFKQLCGGSFLGTKKGTRGAEVYHHHETKQLNYLRLKGGVRSLFGAAAAEVFSEESRAARQEVGGPLRLNNEDFRMLVPEVDVMPINFLARAPSFQTDGVQLLENISPHTQKALHIDGGRDAEIARLEFVKEFLRQEASKMQQQQRQERGPQKQERKAIKVQQKRQERGPPQKEWQWLTEIDPEKIGLVEIRDPSTNQIAVKRGHFPETSRSQLVPLSQSIQDYIKSVALAERGRPATEMHLDFPGFYNFSRKSVFAARVGAAASGSSPGVQEVPVEELRFKDRQTFWANQVPAAPGGAHGGASTGRTVEQLQRSAAGSFTPYEVEEFETVVGHVSEPRPETVPILQSSIFLDVVNLWNPLEIAAEAFPLAFLVAATATAPDCGSGLHKKKKQQQDPIGNFTTDLAEVQEAIKTKSTAGGLRLKEIDVPSTSTSSSLKNKKLMTFFRKNMTPAQAWIFSSARVYHGALPLNREKARYSAESRYAVYDTSKWRHYSFTEFKSVELKLQMKLEYLLTRENPGKETKQYFTMVKEKAMVKERMLEGEEKRLYWQWVAVGSEFHALMEKWLKK